MGVGCSDVKTADQESLGYRRQAFDDNFNQSRRSIQRKRLEMTYSQRRTASKSFQSSMPNYCIEDEDLLAKYLPQESPKDEVKPARPNNANAQFKSLPFGTGYAGFSDSSEGDCEEQKEGDGELDKQQTLQLVPMSMNLERQGPPMELSPSDHIYDQGGFQARNLKNSKKQLFFEAKLKTLTRQTKQQYMASNNPSSQMSDESMSGEEGEENEDFEFHKSPTQKILSRDNSFIIDSEKSSSGENNENEQEENLEAPSSPPTVRVSKKKFNSRKALLMSQHLINKDILKEERQISSPTARGSQPNSLEQTDMSLSKRTLKHYRSPTQDTSPAFTFKSSSEVVLRTRNESKPGSATSKISPSRPKPALLPVSKGQQVIEKLKYEQELQHMSTYKAVANFTFSNGVVFEGILNLDSTTLKIEQNFTKDSTPAVAAIDPTLEVTQQIATTSIKDFEIRRNTFVLTVCESSGNLQLCIRVTPQKVAVLSKLLTNIMAANAQIVAESEENDEDEQCNMEEYSVRDAPNIPVRQFQKDISNRSGVTGIRQYSAKMSKMDCIP